MSTRRLALPSVDPGTLLDRLRLVVYTLAALLAFSLLVVGTIAVIAELKGTWHWAVHLESTVSYMGVVVAALVTALVPLTAFLYLGRWYRGRA